MQSGIIFDIKRYAVHDGPGIRTTIFFKGCPLSCTWCHNPESRSFYIETVEKSKVLDKTTYKCNEEIGRVMSSQEVINEIGKEHIFMEESNGGVSFSGGEPLAQADFLLDLLKKCKELGWHCCVDTSGHADNQLFQSIMEYTDLFLIDLKIIDHQKHKKYTGVSNEKILKNIKSLIEHKKDFRIRIPFIPGITNNDNIDEIITYLEQISTERFSIDLLPFHENGKNKYQQLKLKDPLIKKEDNYHQLLNLAQKKLQTAGHRVKIGG